MAHLKMLLCCQPTFNVPSFLKTFICHFRSVWVHFKKYSYVMYVELSYLIFIRFTNTPVLLQ